MERIDDQIIRENIKNLTENINFQKIKLIDLEFQANEMFAGVVPEGQLERKIGMTLVGIGAGYDQEENLTIFGDYDISIEDVVKDLTLSDLNIDDGSLFLAKFKCKYRIFLILKKEFSFAAEELNQSELWKTVINIYFQQTGKLIIFPYVRHLYDTMCKEADFAIPVIPPILLKS